jgi:hypothetical protein
MSPNGVHRPCTKPGTLYKLTSSADYGFFFASAEEALEAAGLDERSEALWMISQATSEAAARRL